jgi:hypothetical protein
LIAEHDRLLNKISKFWADVVLEIDQDSARRLLPLYSALELMCDNVISTLASVSTFRLNYDRMGLGNIAWSATAMETLGDSDSDAHLDDHNGNNPIA